MSFLYAGLDVSLEMTSNCVVDADGRVRDCCHEHEQD